MNSPSELDLQSRNLGDSQVRSLLDEPLDFLDSPDHMADSFLVADSVVLKAFWRVGELGRSHLIHPLLTCVSCSASAR